MGWIVEEREDCYACLEVAGGKAICLIPKNSDLSDSVMLDLVRKVAALPALVELAYAATDLPGSVGDFGKRVVWQIEDGGPPAIQVIVGNVGTVYDDDSIETAEEAFRTYVRQSKSGKGRASGEFVVLMQNGEVIKEHKRTASDE